MKVKESNCLNSYESIKTQKVLDRDLSWLKGGLRVSSFRWVIK